MVDHSINRSVEILYDVLIKVSSFIFPLDFVILDYKLDFEMPKILSRTYLVTGRFLIDIEYNNLKFRLNNEEV